MNKKFVFISMAFIVFTTQSVFSMTCSEEKGGYQLELNEQRTLGTLTLRGERIPYGELKCVQHIIGTPPFLLCFSEKSGVQGYHISFYHPVAQPYIYASVSESMEGDYPQQLATLVCRD